MAAESAYRPPSLDSSPPIMLHRNEGRLPAKALPNIAATPADRLRCYPDASKLESIIARKLGIKPNRVSVTAGGDDALLRTFLAYLEPSRSCILPAPTFEMLTRYAALAGGSVRSVRWTKGEYPVDAVLKSAGDLPGLIAVVSPNNPTGAVISAVDLRRLSKSASNQLIVLDLAYTEFADVDLTDLALDLPNVVAIRTFSKAWGMAGLRCGYALGPAEAIDALRRAGNPFPVSGPALFVIESLAAAGLGSQQGYIDQVRRERERLFQFLTDCGCDAVPSQANFVFAKTPRAESIWRALGDRGIAVRWFSDGEDLVNALRITCPGDEAVFAQLIKVLGEIFNSRRERQ
jgi:histidinol-phosphate aminotransferase